MAELPERRTEHGLPAPSEMRHTLAQLAYTDADSVRDAAQLRERAAAVADVAKRAHVDEVEYALVAREAERAVGRMLAAGREAGDVATKEGRNVQSAARIEDLGIEHNLAADAARFAQIADELWADVVKRARETEAVSRSAFRAAVAGTMGPRQPEPSSVEYQIRLFERGGKYGDHHGALTADNSPVEHHYLPAAWDETDEARRRLIKRRISDPLDGLVCGLYRWSGPWRAQCPCCGRFEVYPEPISEHFDMQHVPELLDMQHPPICHASCAPGQGRRSSALRRGGSSKGSPRSRPSRR